MTSENRTVLQKIKNAAKAAGSPRKPNRIELIERNRKLRSRSIFRRLSTDNEKRYVSMCINVKIFITSRLKVTELYLVSCKMLTMELNHFCKRAPS